MNVKIRFSNVTFKHVLTYFHLAFKYRNSKNKKHILQTKWSTFTCQRLEKRSGNWDCVQYVHTEMCVYMLTLSHVHRWHLSTLKANSNMTSFWWISFVRNLPWSRYAQLPLSSHSFHLHEQIFCAFSITARRHLSVNTQKAHQRIQSVLHYCIV